MLATGALGLAPADRGEAISEEDLSREEGAGDVPAPARTAKRPETEEDLWGERFLRSLLPPSLPPPPWDSEELSPRWLRGVEVTLDVLRW